MSSYDVIVIGGGIIGSSIAFELAGANLRVLLLDSEQPGQQASRAAAGMLSPGPHLPSDPPLVPFAQWSLSLYPEFVAALEPASEKTAAFARDGAIELFLSATAEADRDAALAQNRRLGLRAEVQNLPALRASERLIGPAARAALWLPDEGTVDPRLLMDALLAAARNCGVEVRSRCVASELLLDGRRCAGVLVGGEKVAAAHVVVAAGCFSAAFLGASGLSRFAPTRPVRGQMAALRAAGSRLRRVLRSRHGYLVPRPDGRIIVGSTLEEAGFDNRATSEGIRKLLDAAAEICPELAAAEVIQTWAGLRPGSPDDLPILGPTDVKGLLIATGHYRNGILLAPATAKLLRDWIVGSQPAFDTAIFSPMRFVAPERHPDKAL